MKSKKYYALAGTNAYGVYTNWGRVVHDRDFVSKHKFKKFGTFESAKTYAEQVYDKFQCGAEEGEYCIDEIKEVNILYQRRDSSSPGAGSGDQIEYGSAAVSQFQGDSPLSDRA